ncbi:MAG: UMP kinase [Candidatus ainarchaeum sp.]|nr:UMP kinase [Candidatus ainarchaeum sp.]
MFDMFNEDNAEKYSNESYSDNNSNSNSNSFEKKGFVISVGGSVFIGEKPFVEKIIDFCEVINELNNEFNFIIVVGGGKISRNYISAGMSLGANNFELDSIGISVTKTNAKLFSLAIKKSVVLEKISDAKIFLDQGKIPIFGGLFEGMTTDADSVLLAEKLGFDFINLSNVDGIFDSDPKENENAILFNEISFNDMNFLLKDFVSKPGQNIFLDLQAANIITRSKIKSFFVNGNHLENFKNCLRGNDFKGTIVCDVEDFIEKDSVLDKKSTRKSIKKSKPIKRIRVVEEDEVIDPKDIDFR